MHNMFSNKDIQPIVEAYLKNLQVTWRIARTTEACTSTISIERMQFIITDQIMENTIYNLYFWDSHKLPGFLGEGPQDRPAQGRSDTVSTSNIRTKEDIETLIDESIPSVPTRAENAEKQATEELKRIKKTEETTMMKTSVRRFLEGTDIISWTNGLIQQFYTADIPRMGQFNQDTVNEFRSQVIQIISNQIR